MVISVPSTGTRFMAKLLGHPDVYYHTYLFDNPVEVQKRSDGIIVVPLRRPESAWRTWWQRFGTLDCRMWNDRMKDEHPQSQQAAWRRLEELSQALDIHFVPIDLDVRDQQLAELSKKISKDLVTDWSPVGARPSKEKVQEPPQKDWSWVYDMPFMRKFYANV